MLLDIALTELSYESGCRLVYELGKVDHVPFLCSFHYTSDICWNSHLLRRKRKLTKPISLNYPSLSAQLVSIDDSFTVTFNRTVTNVGTPNSTYKSKVVAGNGFKLAVTERLVFCLLKRQREAILQCSCYRQWSWPIRSGGIRIVRSPTVVYSDNY